MHRTVGLDWAQDSLRVVTLQSGFRGFAIEEVRSAQLPAEGTPAERLKAAVAALGLVPPLGPDDTVAVALSGGLVATHLVTLPFTDPKRIERVLPAEVEGAIPFDLAEVIWDYAVLSQANGKTDLMVGIVRKSVLREYLAALLAGDIDPRVVTLAPLALAGLGEKNLVSGPQDPAAPRQAVAAVLLDAGPDRANLALLDDGRPVLARALATSGAQAWAAAQTDEVARARLLALLSRDLKISLRSKKAAPQKLLLAGAVASLPGAGEKLGAELQLPVESVALPAGTPEDALALGLALRAQHSRGRVNFRKGEFAFTKDFSQVRGQVTRLAVAAVVLLILGLGLGLARVASLHQQAKAYDEAVCAATKRILGTCTTDYRQALGQLSGGRSRAAGVPRVSAADVLAELVLHLPDASLPLLEDLELTTTSVRVKGIAESYGKVDDIVSALKKDKCFGEIKSPRTEQTPTKKISFAFDFGYTCSGETPGGA